MAYSLAEIAGLIGASVVGDPSWQIDGVADLASATPSTLSFFANPKYRQHMLHSKAGAVIIRPTCELPEGGRNFLIHADPSAAFQQVLLLFRSKLAPLTGFTGIHATAVVHPTASIGSDVTVCPYAVIDEGVVVGRGTYVGAHVFIGPRTTIGANAILHPHAVIREGCVLGDYVIIQPGAVVGSCGFGYITDERGIHQKVEQLGNVVIQDHVEIGANTTIDRARFASTVIGEGAKIDNLVQIAHNVEVGRRSILVAQVGVAGSTKLGQYVVLGGKVAVNGHIQLADFVRITACSAVSKSLPKGDYGGSPAQPLAAHNRNAVHLRNVGRLFDRVRALEEQLAAK